MRLNASFLSNSTEDIPDNVLEVGRIKVMHCQVLFNVTASRCSIREFAVKDVVIRCGAVA